jgi:hypothetical protein
MPSYDHGPCMAVSVIGCNPNWQGESAGMQLTSALGWLMSLSMACWPCIAKQPCGHLHHDA